MADPNLITWIQQQQAAGRTTEQIYAALIQQGHQPDQATAAINEASGYDAHQKSLPVHPLVIGLGSFFLVLLVAGISLTLLSGGPSEEPFDLSLLQEDLAPARSSVSFREVQAPKPVVEEQEEEISPSALYQEPAVTQEEPIAAPTTVPEEEPIVEEPAVEENETEPVEEAPIIEEPIVEEEPVVEDNATEAVNETEEPPVEEEQVSEDPAPEEQVVEEIPPSGEGVTHTVEITGYAFVPETLEINSGDSVEWINLDDVPHTATALDDSFNSEFLDVDAVFTHTFTVEGTTSYTCEFHPSMTGSITVNPIE